MKKSEIPETLSLDAVAKVLQLKTTYVRTHWRTILKDHGVKCYQPGVKILVDKDDLQRMIRRSVAK